jgi:hypothetical protein
VRLVIALVVVWLIVGVAATVQRGYFTGNNATCAKTGTITVTVFGGASQLRRCQPEAQLPRAEAVEAAENWWGLSHVDRGVGP